MPDLDEDHPDYRRGPGRGPKSSRGAVIEAYVDTDALDRKCDGLDSCGADLGEFCKSPDGFERHMPCASRTKPRPESDSAAPGIPTRQTTATNTGGA